MALRTAVEGMRPELVELRRSLHREPEIGLHVPLTQAKGLAALDGLPLEVSTGRGLTSVTAGLRGGSPRPAGPPRPDMNPLPGTGPAGLPYAWPPAGGLPPGG